MLIGVPKEIKKAEFRIAATPAGVKTLCDAGHRVLIEKGGGEGSGFLDDEFKKVGAEIINDKRKIFDEAQLIYHIIWPFNLYYANDGRGN